MTVIHPKDWAPPIGYANGIRVPAGQLLFVAGQVGWDQNQIFHSEDLAAQFEQALRNVIAVVEAAGGGVPDICRMTVYCTDKLAYLAARSDLGQVWRRLMGRHYPAMTLVFVSDLLDHPGMIELEATAVLGQGETP